MTAFYLLQKIGHINSPILQHLLVNNDDLLFIFIVKYLSSFWLLMIALERSWNCGQYSIFFLTDSSSVMSMHQYLLKFIFTIQERNGRPAIFLYLLKHYFFCFFVLGMCDIFFLKLKHGKANVPCRPCTSQRAVFFLLFLPDTVLWKESLL